MNRYDLVRNRTIADVNLKNEKGTYNIEDLNRVETWCKYLANKLYDLGYGINVNTKMDWKMTDRLNLSSINRIKRNLEKLKKVYCALNATPVADLNKKSINYIDANDFEKILFDIDFLIECMENNFVYSGVATSGQNRMWQQRYRRSVYTPVVLEEVTITGVYNSDQVTVTGVGTHYKGYTVTLNATPIAGNRIITAMVGGEVVTLPYTFKIETDTTFSIVSEAIPQYTVNANYNSNQVTIAGAGTYYENASVTLTATPNTGCQIDSIKLDGVNITLPYTFEISKDVTLEVESSIIQCAISMEYDPNQVEVTGSGTYDYGSVVTLTALPLTGYKIDSVLVNGIERTLPYTLTITGDLSVSITSSIVTLTVSATYNSDQVEIAGLGSYDYGKEVTIDVTAVDGYKIDSITINNAVITVPYTFNITSDVSLNVESSSLIVTATVSATYDADQVTINGLGTYEIGTEVTIDAVANTGYQINTVTLNGAEITLPHTFTIETDTAFTIESGIKQCTLSYGTIQTPLYIQNTSVTTYDSGVSEASEEPTIYGTYDYGTTIEFSLRYSRTLFTAGSVVTKANDTVLTHTYSTSSSSATYKYSFTITEDTVITSTNTISQMVINYYDIVGSTTSSTGILTWNMEPEIAYNTNVKYPVGTTWTINSITEPLGVEVTRLVYGEASTTSYTIKSLTLPHTFTLDNHAYTARAYTNTGVTYMVTGTYDNTQVALSTIEESYLRHSEVTIDATPLDGYKIDSVTVNGEQVTLPYTFEILSDVTFAIASSAASEVGTTWDYSADNLVFTGSEYVNTGLKLFDTAKSWVVICSASTTDTGTSTNTAWHCLYESSPYPGVALDLQGSIRGRLAMKTSLSNVFPVSLTGTQQTMALERDMANETYTLFVMNQDGTVTTTDVTSRMSVTTFDTTLTIGAYQTTSGTYGRYWHGTIYGFRVKLDTMSEEDIISAMVEIQNQSIL